MRFQHLEQLLALVCADDLEEVGGSELTWTGQESRASKVFKQGQALALCQGNGGGREPVRIRPKREFLGRKGGQIQQDYFGLTEMRNPGETPIGGWRMGSEMAKSQGWVWFC